MKRTAGIRLRTAVCLALCVLVCTGLTVTGTELPGIGVPAHADLMNVGGTLRYYDQLGREAEEIGVDLSQFNNKIDFEALKTQGFGFVVVRLGGRGWGGTGRLYTDRETQNNLRLAREAGLKVGAYFYSTAVNATEAIEEAAAALKILDGFPLDLPIWIDMEYSGEYPYGRADQLSPGTRADVIETFCTAVREAGYEAGLYASEGYVRFDLDAEAVNYLPLWMASYTVDNMLPQYITTYDIWQQTDSAYAGGADGALDLNIILPP